MDRIAQFISGWFSRHAWLVLGICLAITIPSVHYSIELFKNLRTDMEELLPNTARSVLDLNEVTARLESIESLAILVFSKHPEGSKRYVDELAHRLEAIPRDIAARVEYKIDREIEFFQRRRALFLETEDLKKILKYVNARIEYEKDLYNPLNIIRETELVAPVLNIGNMREKYAGRVSSYTKFEGGYYASTDKTIRVILVYLSGKSSGITASHRLREAVDTVLANIDSKKYAPDIEVKFSNGVQNLIEEHASLIADLVFSTLAVMAIVTVCLFVFYRGFVAPMLMTFSLLIGTFWTFGASYFLVGYLNANSAFLGAIVLGNGINFGIIHLARYLEERRKGQSHVEALGRSLSDTVTATWTAALAAGLAYGSLVLTEFRGFRQFGIIGLAGMVLCWLSAFTALPALLSVADRIGWLKVKVGPSHRGWVTNFVAWSVGKYPRAILILSFVALGLVGLAVWQRPDRQIIETDMTQLRDKKSMEEGSGYLSKYLDEVFERYLSPIVILPKSRESALEISRRLVEEKRSGPDGKFFDSVYSMDIFVPPRQEEKIALINEINKKLTPRIRRELSADDNKLVNEFLTPEAFRTFTIADLPPLVQNRFREKDGTIGKMVLVEPPLDSPVINDGDLQVRWIGLIRRVADSVEPGTAVAGQLPVTNDMYLAITRDGPKATLFALFSVILLVIILFRNARISLLVVLALGLGVTWLGGLIWGSEHKINFLNFIALPITFGIGVDYAVNIIQRYRIEGPGSMLNVIRSTGGAVMLASLTTMTGYGSLLVAGNRAFVSFGRIAVWGEITCLIAAMFTVPALIVLLDRRAMLRSKPLGSGASSKDVHAQPESSQPFAL